MFITKLFRLFKLKFIKINHNLIVFTSFNGQFSDSPKYLSEAIHRINSKIEIVWILNNTEQENLPSYIKTIKNNTKEADIYKSQAHIRIDNVYGDNEVYLQKNSIISKLRYKLVLFLKSKNNQKIYTTWHGTPLKKMGIDQLNNNIIDFDCRNTTMILGNEYTLKIMQRLTFNKLNYKLLGCPRNDILTNNKINIKNIKKDLKLPLDKKIALYAPSFRVGEDGKQDLNRSGLNQIVELDINKLCDKLNAKFSGDWVLVCRFHYHVEKLIDWNKLKKISNDRIINGNKYEDMSLYLKCSDILITDISSSMFDFSIINKPVFLLFPDYKYYKNRERGLYINIDDLPYKLALDTNELIKNIEEFNKKEYSKELKSFNNRFKYVNLNDSSSIIAKYILEDGDMYEKNN